MILIKTNMTFLSKVYKNIITILLILMLVPANTGCKAQKHHQKSMPCPCEKRL